MKFKSLFYDSKINLKSISKRRIISAILLGITSALIIYSFFYVLRETFRLLTGSLDNIPNIISEENRGYYNLFFAFLSVVFGNSIAFNFVFSRPQEITHRFNSKRKRLLNDNIFLSFNFSYWFAKIGLSFGVFAMCCMEYEFLPYFKELSFLLILVLYLESLKSFSFFLKNKNRLIFILLHVMFLSILSFGISKINVVNYKGLDNAMLENNPMIDLPNSSYYDRIDYKRYNIIKIKLVEDSLGIPHIYSDNIKYRFSDLPAFIKNEKSYMREENIPFLTINVEADKKLNVYNLKKLEQILINMDVRCISYTVDTKEPMFTSYKDPMFTSYERHGIRKYLNETILKINDSSSLFPPPPFFNNDLINSNKPVIKDSIIISIGTGVSWNNNLIKNVDLVEKFRISQNKHTMFIYEFEKEATYQNYITVLSSHFNALNQLRKESETIYRENDFFYSEEYKEEQKKLKEEFPIIIREEFK